MLSTVGNKMRWQTVIGMAVDAISCYVGRVSTRLHPMAPNQALETQLEVGYVAKAILS